MTRELGPVSLAGVEPLGRAQKREVLVVSPNELQGEVWWQHLILTHLYVSCFSDDDVLLMKSLLCP